MKQSQNSGWKAFGAIVILIAGGVFAWSRTKTYVVAQETPAPMVGGPMRGGMMPNREEMQARGEEIRERMAEELKLSDAQKEKMQSLMADGPPSSPEEARARFAAMRETLTPEQQSRMRAAMKKRLLEDPNSPIRNLPPDEQQKFMEKLEKRIESGEPPMLMMGPPPGMAPR